MAVTFSDLLHRYEQNRYAFSRFLGLAEQDDFHRFVQENPPFPYELFGGQSDCERVMLRIGDEESLGYTEPWPIRLLEIAPKNPKFSDALTHRDFLGALIHLGLERDVLGDIYIEDNTGYVFCLDTVAPYIRENLERVRHTSVSCREIESLPALTAMEPDEVRIQCASLRLDLVLSHAYHLSRGAAQALFPAHKVFVEGRLCENPSRILREGERVSVRGFGRLVLQEDLGLSKKGKHNLVVSMTKK